jgi:hypothetical protein
MSATPAKIYESKLLTRAIAAGPPRMRFPLPQNAPIQFAAYALDQEFEMLLSSFPPAPKNTPSNAASGGTAVFAGMTDANAILTKLSQPTPTGGGRGRFTASFAIIPASWDDFKTQAVTFPGWLDTAVSGRARSAISDSVNIRLRYDYFLVDPSSVAAGVLNSAGAAITIVANMGAIPAVLRAIWLNQGGSYPILNSDAKDLTDGGTLGDVYYTPTFPTLTQWQAMIVNAATYASGASAWSASAPPICAFVGGSSHSDNFGSAGQYCFSDSTLRVYEGQIIERCSYFVLPK